MLAADVSSSPAGTPTPSVSRRCAGNNDVIVIPGIHGPGHLQLPLVAQALGDPDWAGCAQSRESASVPQGHHGTITNNSISVKPRAGSADLQSAVSRIFNPHRRAITRGTCRLQTCDTADCKSALRNLPNLRPVPFRHLISSVQDSFVSYELLSSIGHDTIEPRSGTSRSVAEVRLLTQNGHAPVERLPRRAGQGVLELHTITPPGHHRPHQPGPWPGPAPETIAAEN